MPGIRRLGSHEEDRAANYLLSLGYTLLGRRVKLRTGELDLVAFDGDILVFVEVKSRATGLAEESVSRKKVGYLIVAAQEYCRKFELEDRECRFDLIAVEGDQLRHHIGGITPD